MSYASGHTSWNKLVRDNIPTSLEAKGIKTSYRIVESKDELIGLFLDKIEEEVDEFKAALESKNQEKILEEAADIRETSNSLLKFLLKTTGVTSENITEIYRIYPETMRLISNAYDLCISEIDIELFPKIKEIQNKKREEKGGFEKGIFLISTDS